MWLAPSAVLGRLARSRARAPRIRSRWRFPVTASCRPPAALGGYRWGASRKKAILAREKGGRRAAWTHRASPSYSVRVGVESIPDAMTRYGRSPWVDQFPKSRVPAYPRQRGALETDVVIVGGGLTGCATAYAFAAAGVKVTLVEAAQIGHGSSGSTGGWISEDPGVAFVDLEKTHGLRAARHVFQAWRRAALDFVALLRRLDVKCQLEARGSLTLAATPEQAARMKRDQKSRRGAGLDAPMLTARVIKGETALDAALGLRATAPRSIPIARAWASPPPPLDEARCCSSDRPSAR